MCISLLFGEIRLVFDWSVKGTNMILTKFFETNIIKMLDLFSFTTYTFICYVWSLLFNGIPYGSNYANRLAVLSFIPTEADF